jgi:hypothetical protein
MEFMAKPIHAFLFLISFVHSCEGFSIDCPIARADFQSARNVGTSIQQLRCPLGRYSWTRPVVGAGMQLTIFYQPLLIRVDLS